MGVSSTLDSLPTEIKVVLLIVVAVPTFCIVAWALMVRNEVANANKSKFKRD
jgi:hypothetical protein